MAGRFLSTCVLRLPTAAHDAVAGEAGVAFAGERPGGVGARRDLGAVGGLVGALVNVWGVGRGAAGGRGAFGMVDGV
jgi:hypothetical protein